MTPYIVAYSGTRVSVDEGVPTLQDIALSLSRQPRFGGMCRRWWSVIDHSLFTARLAQLDGAAPKYILSALLHDAHEWTGDIPTPFKTDQQRFLQRAMDRKIYDAYFSRPLSYRDLSIPDVAQWDHRALLAEAVVVGPPCFVTAADIVRDFGLAPNSKDVTALQTGLADGRFAVSASELDFGIEARNVRGWMKHVTEMQTACYVRERNVQENSFHGFQQGRPV